MARHWNEREHFDAGRGRYRGRAYNGPRENAYPEYLGEPGRVYFPFGDNLEPVRDHFRGQPRGGWNGPRPGGRSGMYNRPAQSSGQGYHTWPADRDRYDDYFRERQLRRQEQMESRRGGDFRRELPVPYRRNIDPRAEYHDFGGQDRGYYDAYGRGIGPARYNRYKLPGQ